MEGYPGAKPAAPEIEEAKRFTFCGPESSSTTASGNPDERDPRRWHGSCAESGRSQMSDSPRQEQLAGCQSTWLRCRVEGLGVRVQGLGLRVYG